MTGTFMSTRFIVMRQQPVTTVVMYTTYYNVQQLRAGTALKRCEHLYFYLHYFYLHF